MHGAPPATAPSMRQVMFRISAGLLMFRIKHGQVQVLLAPSRRTILPEQGRGDVSIPRPKRSGRRFACNRTAGIPRGSSDYSLRPLHCLAAGETKGRQDGPRLGVPGRLRSERYRQQLVYDEWPPHSGRQVEFPEIDRAEFFDLAMARRRSTRHKRRGSTRAGRDHQPTTSDVIGRRPRNVTSSDTSSRNSKTAWVGLSSAAPSVRTDGTVVLPSAATTLADTPTAFNLPGEPSDSALVSGPIGTMRESQIGAMFLPLPTCAMPATIPSGIFRCRRRVLARNRAATLRRLSSLGMS